MECLSRASLGWRGSIHRRAPRPHGELPSVRPQAQGRCRCARRYIRASLGPVPMRTIPALCVHPFWSGAVGCVPVRFLTKCAAQQCAQTEKQGSCEQDDGEDNDQSKKTRARLAARHKLQRYSAPAQRSAQLECRRSEEKFHVLESLPILGRA